MNYPSKEDITVRIFVKDFNEKTMSWTCFRAERVAGALPDSYEVIGYDWLSGKSKRIFVYAQEWHSLERVPIYELTLKQVEFCLGVCKVDINY